jgi:hypothetical protein
MKSLDGLPKAAQMSAWIEEVFAQGVRRPGYPADRWAESFVRDHFERLGLERVRLEPVDTPHWEDRGAELVLSDGAAALPCFAVPFCKPNELEAEIVRFDPDAAEAVRGKVALCELTFLSLPSSFPVLERRERGGDAGVAEPAREAGWCHDPHLLLESVRQTLPFTAASQKTMEPAIEAGAIGFVGVLRGYPGGGHDYYVPCDGIMRDIPGVYLSESEGNGLLERLDASGGSLHVRLAVDAERGSVTSHNVVGELPGADEQLVVIGTHHDGPWSSAVEDASGIALLLAQATHWSSVAATDRPHRLVFTVNAGHMAGRAGVHAFLEAHRDELDDVVLELHLEHAAPQCREAAGQLRLIDAPEPRWWFTSENPELERAVWDAIVEEDLVYSLLLTPTALAGYPTTDGGPFHLHGVPLVNFLSAPWYLFDSADTLDKIHEPSLEPVSRAAARIVEWTRGRSAESVRAGVRG